MEKTELMNTKTLTASHLNAFYSNKQILKDFSFELNQKELICLCGPNGAGKSTLLSALCGLENSSLKTQGEVFINEDSDNSNPVYLKNLPVKEKAKMISCLLQSEFSTWDFSVQDFVLQGRFCHTKYANYSKEDYLKMEEALDLMNIQNLKNRTIHSLSGGEFQKVRIARCLCQDSPFLLLDEPASSLDFVFEPKLMEQLKQLSRSKNMGILVSIHDVNMAVRFADKMILLPPQKQAFFGETQSVFTKENLETTFNAPVQIFNHPVYNCPQITLGT